MVYVLALSNGQSYYNLYLCNLLLTPDFGLYENLGADVLGYHPQSMKASITHDPNTTQFHEAMSGEHQYSFLSAMGKEISELEQQNNWKLAKKTPLPRGANLLPSTWAFNIKRYPGGRIRKHKARFCVRGDHQIKNVGFFESCAPVASCYTIQMLMNVAAQRGWATRQLDFSDSFVRATREEEFYVEMPAMLSDKNANMK